jgi:hypothetical protein
MILALSFCWVAPPLRVWGLVLQAWGSAFRKPLVARFPFQFLSFDRQRTPAFRLFHTFSTDSIKPINSRPTPRRSLSRPGLPPPSVRVPSFPNRCVESVPRPARGVPRSVATRDLSARRPRCLSRPAYPEGWREQSKGATFRSEGSLLPARNRQHSVRPPVIVISDCSETNRAAARHLLRR